MQLLVPKLGLGLLVAGPVDVAAEPVHQVAPRRVPIGNGVAGVEVKPVLKGVDCGDPSKHKNDPLKVGDSCAAHSFLVVKLLEKFATKQLHRH